MPTLKKFDALCEEIMGFFQMPALQMPVLDNSGNALPAAVAPAADGTKEHEDAETEEEEKSEHETEEEECEDNEEECEKKEIKESRFEKMFKKVMKK